MYSEIIKLATESLVDQRNKLRYDYSTPISDMIRNPLYTKISIFFILKHLLDLSLNQTNTVYMEIKYNGLSLNEALIKIGL